MVVINDICLDIVYPSRVSTGTSLTEQLVLFMTKIVLFVHFSIEMHASGYKSWVLIIQIENFPGPRILHI